MPSPSLASSPFKISLNQYLSNAESSSHLQLKKHVTASVSAPEPDHTAVPRETLPPPEANDTQPAGSLLRKCVIPFEQRPKNQ